MRGLAVTTPSVSAALVALALGAGAAAAQPAVTEMTVDGKTSLTDGFGRADCDSTDTMLLRLRVSVDQPRYYARFVLAPGGLPGGMCPTDIQEPELTEVFAASPLDALSGVLELDRAVLASELMGTLACSADGRRFTGGAFCLQLTLTQSDATALLVHGIALDFDTTTPPAITIDAVALGDGGATLTVGGVPDDDESYQVVVDYRQCPEQAATDGGTTTDAGTTDTDSLCGASAAFSRASFDDGVEVRLEGLENGVRVEARAALRDDFDNLGPWSELVLIEPAPTLGTFDLYDGNGGDLSCSPSCGAGTTGTTAAANAGFAAAFVLGLTKRGRRLLRAARRRRLGVLTVFAVLLVGALASPAHAGFGQQTLSLAVSPYKPAIDTEYVAGYQRIFPVYGCLFSGATLVEIGGDADTHLWDGFGSVQVSAGLNLAQARGKAQPMSVLTSGQCETATDTDVELTLLKLRPGITYRADQLLDWLQVPLVPYARVGLVASAFAFTKEGAFEQGAVEPVGLRFGWEAAAGLMLALDFLDAIDPFVPDTTRRARANGTFDHTFLFAEGAWQRVDSFGRPGLVLSPDDVFLGTRMPVMWKLGVAVELL